MWDGWETSYSCIRKMRAEVSGYRRAFNKASTVNWGTKGDPCPTLNLVADPSGTCSGIAFEFPEDRAEEVHAYLLKREGRHFRLQPLHVRTEAGSEIEALVPLYSGPNTLRVDAPAEVVGMLLRAKGKDGSGVDYVRGVAQELAKNRIEDACVAEIVRHLNRALRDASTDA